MVDGIAEDAEQPCLIVARHSLPRCPFGLASGACPRRGAPGPQSFRQSGTGFSLRDPRLSFKRRGRRGPWQARDRHPDGEQDT